MNNFWGKEEPATTAKKDEIIVEMTGDFVKRVQSMNDALKMTDALMKKGANKEALKYVQAIRKGLDALDKDMKKSM